MSKKQDKNKQENPSDEELPPEEEVLSSEPQEDGGLEKLKEQCEDYKRKWYAVSAEYDNFRKRNSASVSKAYKDGIADTVLKILPVADNFGYALLSASDEKTKAGIDKVIKSFNTILSSFGVEEIEVEAGAPFDESFMEAVMNLPCEGGEKPNTVKQVVKKGYKAGDRVIRYAQVMVTV